MKNEINEMFLSLIGFSKEMTTRNETMYLFKSINKEMYRLIIRIEVQEDSTVANIVTLRTSGENIFYNLVVYRSDEFLMLLRMSGVEISKHALENVYEITKP